MDQSVAVVRVDEPEYPKQAPYHPAENYPEYPFTETGQKNYVYAGIRQLFHQLELDSAAWNTPAWNPLGTQIEPGMTVVLNPNFVLSRHKHRKDLFSIITHPSVLRAIADYCWIALQGSGKIIIADAPQYNCNFTELLEVTRLDEVVDFYRASPGPRVSVIDLRDCWSGSWQHASLMKPLPGDPAGSLIVDLGDRSMLCGKSPDKFFGSAYNRKETFRYHSEGRHEYEVSRTIMNADVVIAVPKMKAHKKAGITLNVKGMVGIATNKNHLVHFCLTPPSRGGDQYPDDLFNPMEELLIRTERWMYDHLLGTRKRLLEYLHRSIYWTHNTSTRRLGLKVDEAKKMFDAGDWHGNDTAWRMVVDLFNVFCFADRDGTLHDRPQRRMFSVIDGIVAGENNGPLYPDPKAVGVLLAGDNLVAVDLVAGRLMGFDPLKTRLYRHLVNEVIDFSIDEIQVISSVPSWNNCMEDTTDRFLNFIPSPGYVGHLEI